MDIFAHALWANAAAREGNKVAEKKNLPTGQAGKKFHINVGWTAFWGIFPDLFAFTIPFILRFFNLLLAGNLFSDFFARPPVSEEGLHNGFGLAHNLYQYSHSLVIWAVVFVLVWTFYKRPRYELLGWLLHILIDIFSHALSFFPTPFLFPISDYKFPYGIAWSNFYFMIINYGLLLLIWGRMLMKDLAIKNKMK